MNYPFLNTLDEVSIEVSLLELLFQRFRLRQQPVDLVYMEYFKVYMDYTDYMDHLPY